MEYCQQASRIAIGHSQKTLDLAPIYGDTLFMAISSFMIIFRFALISFLCLALAGNSQANSDDEKPANKRQRMESISLSNVLITDDLAHLIVEFLNSGQPQDYAAINALGPVMGLTDFYRFRRAYNARFNRILNTIRQHPSFAENVTFYHVDRPIDTARAYGLRVYYDHLNPDNSRILFFETLYGLSIRETRTLEQRECFGLHLRQPQIYRQRHHNIHLAALEYPIAPATINRRYFLQIVTNNNDIWHTTDHYDYRNTSLSVFARLNAIGTEESLMGDFTPNFTLLYIGRAWSHPSQYKRSTVDCPDLINTNGPTLTLNIPQYKQHAFRLLINDITGLGSHPYKTCRLDPHFPHGARD